MKIWWQHKRNTNYKFHLDDAGDDGKSQSNFMKNYKTGGTPWFIFIDKQDHVVFSDFHLNPETAINFLKTM